MILVTGAAGYIGSHFVRYYLKQNPEHELVAIDNLGLGNLRSLDGPEYKRIRFKQTDIGATDELSTIFATYQIKAVVHFAANAYVGESQILPFKYFDNNVIQSLKLLEAMTASGIKELVFSSTCATYGNPKYSPLNEAHSQKPINTYGSTKLMIEEALRALALSKQLKYVCLRYFNAAGADPQPEKGSEIGESHEPESHLIPLALAAALGKRDSLKIFGTDYPTRDGTCVRDYVHVNDLAEAHCLALKLIAGDDYKGDLEESNELGMAINLGTAHGATVKEVVAAVEQVTGKKVPCQLVDRRPGDPAELVADFSKARDILGWQPKFDLLQTVESAYHWESNKRY
jgi:UDP-glucose 4-epimerase